MSLDIAIYSDVICPWCYLGKHRLEEGLRLAGVREVRVSWMPYELNPGMPPGGMARSAYLDAKFGPGKIAEIEATLDEAAARDGLAFNWAGIQTIPNTRKAHMLMAIAATQGRATVAKGALMHAYFREGRNIGDEEELFAVAMSVGLDREAVELAFGDGDLDREIGDIEDRARAIGVSGVPCYIVNRTYAVSGAQPPAFWEANLPQMLAEAG
jgi:predicted DsbA family dithiol-disulfide isomerase